MKELVVGFVSTRHERSKAAEFIEVTRSKEIAPPLYGRQHALLIGFADQEVVVVAALAPRSHLPGFQLGLGDDWAYDTESIIPRGESANALGGLVTKWEGAGAQVALLAGALQLAAQRRVQRLTAFIPHDVLIAARLAGANGVKLGEARSVGAQAHVPVSLPTSKQAIESMVQSSEKVGVRLHLRARE